MRHLLIMLTLCFVTLGCTNDSLPTIGRTKGDMPMSVLLSLTGTCYTVKAPIYFEASFATGMSFAEGTCIPMGRKVGRKTVDELIELKVTITYDGTYYIIKHGH